MKRLPLVLAALLGVGCPLSPKTLEPAMEGPVRARDITTSIG